MWKGNPSGLYRFLKFLWHTEIRYLTFKKRASYIQDGRTATIQMLHFIYFFNKYKY